MSWAVETWRAAHQNGELSHADAALGSRLGRGFQGTRRDALASAATLRLLASQALPEVLEGLNALADPRSPHAGLACATLAKLPAPADLREALGAASERWRAAVTDPFEALSLEQMLSKSDAADSLLRRCAGDESTKRELEAMVLTRLKTGAAPLRRSMLRWVARLALGGVSLNVVKVVEKLAKPKAGEEARRALSALAGQLPALEVDAAIELLASRQTHLLEYWRGWKSLEAAGKAGQLGAKLERVAELHPAAAELELIAKNDAETFLRVRDRAELDAFVRHIAALQLAGKIDQAPQLFPRLSELDLDQHGGLWPRTQQLLFYLGPTQLIGERAVAYFASRALDPGPPGWPGVWRGWGSQWSRSEVSIRALGHASAHPEASGAREALEALLSAPQPAAAYAARALAISSVARRDWSTLSRLLGDKRAELREAVLLGLAVDDFNYARDMRDKPWGGLARSVPIELLEPLGTDRSRGVAELAARLLGQLGRAPPPLAEKTIEALSSDLRSGNYTKAGAAQRQLSGLIKAGYPTATLARFVAPLADSLEARSSAAAPIAGLLDAQVELRELWPALAGAYYANPVGSPLELLPRAAEGQQSALFDPLIEPFLSSVRLADDLLAHFVRYAERRSLAGRYLLSAVPTQLYTHDEYAASCVNALGPQQWPGSLEAP